MTIPARPQIDTERLKEVFGVTGWRLMDLAKKTGLSTVTISKFFNGGGTYRTLFAVAEALDLDPRTLIIKD